MITAMFVLALVGLAGGLATAGGVIHHEITKTDNDVQVAASIAGLLIFGLCALGLFTLAIINFGLN